MVSTAYVSDLKLHQTDEKFYIAEFIHNLKQWHDCLFIVGKHEEEIEEISGRKRYLRLHSSVFRKLLTDTNTTIVVCIRDVSPDVFKLMLNHMYGGKLPHLHPDVASRLAAAAHLYRVHSLSK
ncbi:hypothetical protein J6590_030515 [Homalodisca vitripennis]|nr:hypothetical protein J6590_030515 [Homalodisca vitripennis]